MSGFQPDSRGAQGPGQEPVAGPSAQDRQLPQSPAWPPLQQSTSATAGQSRQSSSMRPGQLSYDAQGGNSNETTPRASYQPFEASPLRTSLHSQQVASTSQETTPTASPEDSTASFAASHYSQAGNQYSAQQQSRFQGAFAPPQGYPQPPSPYEHGQGQYAASYLQAQQRRPSAADGGAAEGSQHTSAPLGEPNTVVGDAMTSSRLLSNSFNTTQLRSATPTNDYDFRLSPADGSGHRAIGMTPGAGYASSVDADYYSAPPSRLVSRTPTPVTGIAAAVSQSSPEYASQMSAESDEDDSDYEPTSQPGWASIFGLGGSDRYTEPPYRLGTQSGKRGYQALPVGQDWSTVDASAKRPQSQQNVNKVVNPQYTPKSPDGSYGPDGRHYSRRRRRRHQKAPSMMPAPLRVVCTILGKAFRAVFGPIHPLTILLALALVAGFVTSVTMLIMYILNPDKEPLPWRTYCMQQLPFPHDLADALAPVNIVIGVLTVDSKFERRNLIRSTYARHTLPTDENGNPTANVQVKFILGKVRSKHASRIALEMEAYNDIVVLDMDETQSARKTHGFFKWAAENATVPFLRPIAPSKSYSGNAQDLFVPNPSAPGGLSPWKAEKKQTTTFSSGTVTMMTSQDANDEQTRYQVAWKKVDYVVKADDDTFIVLDELERHLRVAPRELTYWGYLVKNWFMGGEAYALSYDLVDWMAHSPEVSRTAKGKEDIRTPQWIALHPNRSAVNWVSEHCWIYDHPKANTPYSHGILFPDYVEKIKLEGRHGLSEQEIALRGGEHASHWYSTVNKWHHAYRLPRPGMTAEEQVEALVEGGGRWAGAWVRGSDGSTSERWVPYHEIVYEASDERLRPSATDSDGRAALAADVGLEAITHLPIYGSMDHGLQANVSVPGSKVDPSFGMRNASAEALAQHQAARAASLQKEKRDLLADLSSLPRKFLNKGGSQSGNVDAASAQGRVDAGTRYIPRPTPKDTFGEWDALRAQRYLHRPHGGTVIVHYLKRTEYWLETALLLTGKGKLWQNGAGGRGKEWRMGGSPLVRSDGYILEGRSAPRHDPATLAQTAAGAASGATSKSQEQQQA